mmetsp:Transcript_47127/g.137015  ORF Transcript_47127/g.137015 Transcript_47127/m.137015 type:complete len:402 (-) Transcript_47127:337-1542(-)
MELPRPRHAAPRSRPTSMPLCPAGRISSRASEIPRRRCGTCAWKLTPPDALPSCGRCVTCRRRSTNCAPNMSRQHGRGWSSACPLSIMSASGSSSASHRRQLQFLLFVQALMHERSRADVVATDLAEAQRTLEEHVVQLAGAGREYSDEVMCERRRADLAAKELAEAQWAFEASEEHAQKVAVATSATTDELAHERRRAAAAAVELAEAHRALETSEEEFNEQLACANAEVQRIREIVDVLRRELQEAQVTIHETQVQLKGSDIRCDALQATSQHREDRVQELEGLLRDRAAQVGELQDVVQQRDVRLREIENLLCQRDIRVAELERKNSERPSPSRFVAEATCRLQIANLVGGRAAARLNVGHASRSSGESRAVGGRLPPPGGGAHRREHLGSRGANVGS